MRLLTAAVTISLLLTGASAPAQEPSRPFSEEIDVSAVLLDVIVTDSKGNQILGLGKDDFILSEDGVEQPIDSVDYFTNRRMLDQREESAPFKVEQIREDRYFVFFFDRPSPAALFDQLTFARKAVREFIRNEMKPADRIAIVGHDARLKIYSDFTSDPATLERALEDATRFGPGLTQAEGDGAASLLSSIDLDLMLGGAGTMYEAIDLLADALRPIRARKNLVLFSPGIADRDEIVRNGMLMSRSSFVDPMLESLNAANVSVYAVQLLRNAGTDPVFHQRLGEMADATGGRYFQFNTSFKPALEKVENLSNGYYLLTYQARHPRGERGFQKVRIKLRDPELRVVARSGYAFGS